MDLWKKFKIKKGAFQHTYFTLTQNFESVWHVSYTNLKAKWVIHSWDIQSAPNWAVEYVDIDLQKLKLKNGSVVKSLKETFFGNKKISKKIKYIAVQIYKFSWDNFEDIECFAGWQIRDKINSNYKKFDEKTVANKFDLYWTGWYFVLIILDLESEEIVYTDLAIDALNEYNNVEGAFDIVWIITSQVLNFINTKPNIYDLLKYHTKAKKLKIVENRQKADIVCDVLDWTYNIKNSEKILSELL